MKDYLGVLPDMYSNKTSLPLQFAPQKILVNLETMEILKTETAGASGFVTFSVDDAIEACGKL